MTTAFIFPGQGSQSIGMLTDLAASHPEIIQTFTEASDVLQFDLWQLIQSGPEETLNATENAQPALLTASIAIWRLWQQHSELRPKLLAGHSLGEYTALVAAGVIPFAQAVNLVRTRGQLMQQAVPEGEGAMAAILGMEDAQVIELCEQASDNQHLVTAANFNSPGQVVVAGHTAAVDKVLALSLENGGKRSIKLAVSVPSHCPLMHDAAEKLHIELDALTLSSPNIPVIQNVDAVNHETIEDIRQAVIEQLTKPVRWSASVQYMANQGIEQLFECGPGKVLSGLNRRINRELSAFPLLDSASFNKALDATAS